ncbi:manganese catalase family protein [Alkalibaculum sp. M08DMB]|uniref:Manganese catalase family protein n=1 Tax=Alkalibaculum sporogenes TaxID=2655001 RepID=A0A6A7KC58_9FIRM|nr:manganese catalase family protein [Alkalibaculum sporogenes]MPW27129.1 manganese catalase family protein [Alkalibaculum sporogenes]
MWIYEKKTQIPVKVSNKDVRMAKIVLEQYGGADGEAAAGMRYLTQRFAMPVNLGKAVLTDIGTEELAHMEVVATLFSKLIEGATKTELEEAGFDGYYVQHGFNPFYVNSDGVPFTASYFQTKGDPVVDMYEDMAAEQKARITYENLLKFTDDPCVKDVLRFLREREVVHFQRFGETLRVVEEFMGEKKVF